MRKNKLLLLLALLMTAATGAWAQSALTGAFTINADGDQVQFSSGNLQATYNGTAWSWAFATNQWDIIGNEAANTSINGDGTISGTGTVDLFGWVGVNSAFTGTAIYGITNSTTADQYGNTKDEALKSDWGNTIGAGWYTLTIDEWTYVLNTRTTTSGVRYAKATVNGIEGLILLPDDWSTGYYSLASTNTTDAAFTSNEISSTDWTNSLEAHGAVFLPACGYRNGTTVTISSPNQGFYWSSTSSSSNALQARRLNFNNIGLNLNSGTVRTRGHSVRLVKAAEASPGGSGDETYSVTMKDGVKDADKWTITPNEGLKEGDAVTLTYSGRLKVKGVKATSDAAPAEPAAIINGKFSVSDTKQVYFSKGNLRYVSGAWSFFDNQYDYYATYSEDAWDKFGWSNSTNDFGKSTSTNNNDYKNDLVDWGTVPGIGSGWRILTLAEWQYLFSTRSASTVNSVANARYTKGKVNNVYGIILFPDTYTHPDGVTNPVGINDTGNTGWNGNNYNATDWGKMEAAGCVFLPAAGYRDGTSVSSLGSSCSYRSSTRYSPSMVQYIYFESSLLNLETHNVGYYGQCVRLVREVAE